MSGNSRRIQKPRPSVTEHRLSRALARRCQGKTALLGLRWPALELELRTRNVDLRSLGDELPPASRETFDTVLLLRFLEYRFAREHSALLREVWRRVDGEGRLLVCVPNEDHIEDPGAKARFTRRGLKRLLKCIDRPHVMKNQPHRWLVMYVDARPRPDRASLERHEIIASLCRGRVLELGCGYGHLCHAIAGRGLPVEGVDKSDLKISRARQQFPDIPFRRQDILDLPTSERRDTVILAEVLEHVPEDVGDRILEKAWDLVAKGGRLVVSVPNEDCVPHPNHVREFSREDLARLLARFGRPQPVADQPFKWLLTYVDRLTAPRTFDRRAPARPPRG